MPSVKKGAEKGQSPARTGASFGVPVLILCVSIGQTENKPDPSETDRNTLRSLLASPRGAPCMDHHTPSALSAHTVHTEGRHHG